MKVELTKIYKTKPPVLCVVPDVTDDYGFDFPIGDMRYFQALQAARAFITDGKQEL